MRFVGVMFKLIQTLGTLGKKKRVVSNVFLNDNFTRILLSRLKQMLFKSSWTEKDIMKIQGSKWLLYIDKISWTKKDIMKVQDQNDYYIYIYI